MPSQNNDNFSDFIEWDLTPQNTLLLPANFGKNGMPILAFNAGTAPIELQDAVTRWHHIHLSFLDPEKKEEVFISGSVRGTVDSTRILWTMVDNDTFKDRVETVKTEFTKFKDKLNDLKSKMDKVSCVRFHIRSQIGVKLVCSCPDVNLGSAKLDGTVAVLNTYYLPNFYLFNEKGWNRRERLRKVNSITSLFQIPEIKFGDDLFYSCHERETKLVSDADRIGVFRNRLQKSGRNGLSRIEDYEQWLNKKLYRYILDGDVMDELEKRGLRNSRILASIGRNGIVEINHESDIKGTVIEAILAILNYYPPQESEKTGYCRTAAELFVKTVQNRLSSLKPTDIRVQDEDWDESLEKHLENVIDLTPKNPPHRERQRYIVIKVDRVICSKCKHVIIPESLADQYSFSAAFLEGHLVYDPFDGTRLALPTGPPSSLPSNYATLSNELFIMGFERTLIYNSPKTVMHTGNIVDDDDVYWRCIVRAFQHFLAVKTAVHLLENWTIRTCSRLKAELSRAPLSFWPTILDGKARRVKRENEKIIKDDLSQLLGYVPIVREMTVASSAFRSTAVVEKFRHLAEKIFHLPDIIANVQANLDEIVGSMRYGAVERRTQTQGRIAQYLTILGILLAIFAAFLAAPSSINAVTESCRVFPRDMTEEKVKEIREQVLSEIPEIRVWKTPDGTEHFDLMQCIGKPDVSYYGGIFLFGSLFLGIVAATFYTFKDVTTSFKWKRVWIFVFPVGIALFLIFWRLLTSPEIQLILDKYRNHFDVSQLA